MNIIFALFLGFLSSAIGILPPGLINLTAAKVNLKEGKKAALWFIAGAVIVIFFQCYLAVIFAQFINTKPDIVFKLREIGCVLFSILTIYFLWIAKAPNHKEDALKKQKKSTRFFLGLLLSALNVFPIPYYVLVSISLNSYKIVSFNNIATFAFVGGVVIGSYTVFYGYIIYFNRFEQKTDYILKNMNYIIGSITGLVAIISLLKILNIP